MESVIDDTGEARPFNGRSPLKKEEYFYYLLKKQLPKDAVSIVDFDIGVCIGYFAYSNNSIYDIDGNFVATHIEDLPLEEPWFDPTDVIGLGFSALFRKSGRLVFKLGVKTTTKVSLRLSAPIITILRRRFNSKIGLSFKNLKFTPKALSHMDEPGRYVPRPILEGVIRYGGKGKDALGKSGKILSRYTHKFNKVSKKYPKGKDYEIEVVVDEKDWTIVHFQYEEHLKKGMNAIKNLKK